MHFVKPQLARPWTERRDFALIEYPGYTIEPKLDGHRVEVIRHDKGVLLLSRTGKRIQPIPWLETWAQRQLSPGTYVDGELVAGANGSSNSVSHLRANSPEKLAYVAFDLLWLSGEDLCGKMWHQRRRALVDLSPMTHEWPISGELQPGHFYIITSRQWSDTLPQSARNATARVWLAQGFEGVIFKDIFAPYKPNSRTAWIKQKWTIWVDVVVTGCDARPSEWRVRPGEVGKDGVHYPDGRHTDPWLAGYVGLTYGYGPIDALPEQLSDRIVDVPNVGYCFVVGQLGVTGPEGSMKQYVGKVAKCKCWGAYPSGALRHPQPEKYGEWDGGPVLPPEATYDAAGPWGNRTVRKVTQGV